MGNDVKESILMVFIIPYYVGLDKVLLDHYGVSVEPEFCVALVS